MTSRTYDRERDVLLADGSERFGPEVADVKKKRIEHVIERFLLFYPVRSPDPIVELVVYRISKTPFVLVYDYSDTELRIHHIVYARMSRTSVKNLAIEW